MAVRRAGCNTGDQTSFCRGETGPDRGASGPPRANIPNPGISGGIPKEIDCPVRGLAYDYAEKLQGSLRGEKMKLVHDALQLQTDCGMPFVAPVAGLTPELEARQRQQWIQTHHKTVLYVTASDAPRVRGSFREGCSKESPCDNVADAAHLASLVPPSQRPVAIVLGGGIHVLAETLHLGPEHSNCSFVSAPGEKATLTGAVPLDLDWKEFDVSTATGHNIYVAAVGSNVDDILGLRVNGGRAIRARYPNSNPEEQQDTCDRGKTSKEGCPYIMAFQEPQQWAMPKVRT